eukprot:5952868-Pleurochrysis_carterae.AAC.1
MALASRRVVRIVPQYSLVNQHYNLDDTIMCAGIRHNHKRFISDDRRKAIRCVSLRCDYDKLS